MKILVGFCIAVYLFQLFIVVCELATGIGVGLTKKKIKRLFIPFGFLITAMEEYRKREE